MCNIFAILKYTSIYYFQEATLDASSNAKKGVRLLQEASPHPAPQPGPLITLDQHFVQLSNPFSKQQTRALYLIGVS